MINEQIQNYKIISLIGEGGMGDVYLAEHVSISRKVAIKVLKPELVKNEEIRLRFKNEASMLAHLQHPNIVGLIDYVEQDGGLFLIMEYVEGQGLDDLIKAQEAPITIERAKKLMIQIVEAFIYAHKSGIVHRDVKPSNILVTSEDQIKVLDFGIAKLVGEGNFVASEVNIMNDDVQFDHKEGSIDYWVFWVDFSCYRTSKEKYQFCNIKVKLGTDQNLDFVYYEELEVTNLRFE